MRYQVVRRPSPLTYLETTFIRVGLALLICCPFLIERAILPAFKLLVTFILPLSVLAYYSHKHMQKRQTPILAPFSSAKSTAGTAFTLDPLPIHPRVFTREQPSIFDNDNNLERASPSSCTCVPTIPLGRGRRGTTPPSSATNTPPPPPPPPPSPLELTGPQCPVLSDRQWKFHVEGLIAEGTYGRVALATVSHDAEDASPPKQVALKVYSKDQLIVDTSLIDVYDLERKIMSWNAWEKCEWLVQLKGTFGDVYNRYLIMDYYPNTLGGLIFDPRNIPLNRNVVRLWIEELTLAMFELYSRRIVHCDLKPGNILVSSRGHLAIADFGISLTDDLNEDDDDTPFEECTFHGYGGTFAYQAPEMLICHERADFTCASDMWSFGVIIYEICTGKRLFSAEPEMVRNEVWSMDIPAKVREDIPDELTQALVIDLLELDPTKRLTLKDIGTHRFYCNTSWNLVKSKMIKIGFDEVELTSSSWREALLFEKPATPGSLHYQGS